MEIYIIDIILVVFLFLMAILGYKKGFVVRLYDLCATLFVLFMANLLATPFSLIFKIYKYDETDMISSLVGQVVNRILVFVVLIIGLMLVKKLIGLIIKPLLVAFTHTFHLTKWADQCLGFVLSFCQGLVLAYVFFVFIMIPFVDHGKDDIEQSLFAQRIVNFVPSVSEEVLELSSQIQTEEKNAETLTKLVIAANEYDMIDHDQTQLVFEYIQKQMKQEDITLSQNDYNKLEEILLESGYSSQQVQNILKKINVSDEK